jgi:hypothetical protein
MTCDIWQLRYGPPIVRHGFAYGVPFGWFCGTCWPWGGVLTTEAV